MRHFDYIISGAGAAGFSLLLRMLQHQEFDNKRILVVDKDLKNKNDRTWCFWEKQPGLFEPVVKNQWAKVHFFSNNFTSLLDLAPYHYKMIRGIDLYNFVLTAAAKRANVTFKYGSITTAGNEGNTGFITLDGEHYTADYIFNSILFKTPNLPANKYYLLQHFKGFIIETEGDCFNKAEATLMDFRVSQQHGTTFVYVLPLLENRALVEYTLFTPQLLQQEEYNVALQNYIQQYLKIKDYRIVEEEFGIIPMTNKKFDRQVGRIINIGTAGGQTKASSGYTFQFIQKHTEKLVREILRFGYPKNEEGFAERRFKLYDSTLLNILNYKKMPGDKIFAEMFKNNPADRVLRFLDNESTLTDELKLMSTLPQSVFMKAALQELFR